MITPENDFLRTSLRLTVTTKNKFGRRTFSSTYNFNGFQTLFNNYNKMHVQFVKIDKLLIKDSYIFL